MNNNIQIIIYCSRYLKTVYKKADGSGGWKCPPDETHVQVDVGIAIGRVFYAVGVV
jgi:hypothetical protein